LLLHDESPEAVVEREQRFLLTTYSRTPFHPRRGEGARLIDADRNEYWDLLGGIAVNALGHRHPRIVEAFEDGMQQLLHVSNLYYQPAQGILAQKLVEKSLLSKAFFCNSGTEANEAALKFARLARPGRCEVVAVEESFHGRTLGALSITGHEAYRAPFTPLVPGAKFVPPNDLSALQSAVTNQTLAIILEPILGEGGIIPLNDEFLREARTLADRTGAILIFDEIQCGLGRTGTMFAFQQAGVVPDIVTLAKPLGGGLPLGAVLTGPAIQGVVKPGHHGTTFGGNPLACRLGIALIDTIVHERLLDRVLSMGAWFGTELVSLKGRVPSIVDVRGLGMIWGIELNQPAAPVVSALRDKGFIVGSARENVIRLLPPYVVPQEALAAFIEALEQIVGTKTVDAPAVGPHGVQPAPVAVVAPPPTEVPAARRAALHVHAPHPEPGTRHPAPHTEVSS
jgi:acetylornithine/N-succinyldiaminopimelate aminotransferase